MENIISSIHNPIIQHIKSLHIKKNRDKLGQFFIEGFRIVMDALENNIKIEYVVVSDEKKDNVNKLICDLSQKNIKVYMISSKLTKEISDTENSQGIFAVVSKSESNINYLNNIKNSFVIMLDNLQDPGNMGAIIRTADAAGVNGIIISKGSVDIYNPKVLRATMGSIFHTPIIKVDNIEDIITEISGKGYNVFAAHPYGNNDYYNVNMTNNTAIIIGNEANGVSENILRSCNQVKIPMPGKAESLNASISAGILIYECVRQRINS